MEALRALAILAHAYPPSELYMEIIRTIHIKLRRVSADDPGTPWLVRALGCAARPLTPPGAAPLPPSVATVVAALRRSLESCLTEGDLGLLVEAAAAASLVSLSAGNPSTLRPGVEWWMKQVNAVVAGTAMPPCLRPTWAETCASLEFAAWKLGLIQRRSSRGAAAAAAAALARLPQPSADSSSAAAAATPEVDVPARRKRTANNRKGSLGKMRKKLRL